MSGEDGYRPDLDRLVGSRPDLWGDDVLGATGTFLFAASQGDADALEIVAQYVATRLGVDLELARQMAPHVVEGAATKLVRPEMRRRVEKAVSDELDGLVDDTDG